ncbi:F0F1 ATP synthase subunit B [Profundibacterium mesophilum]|uniref:ATP synthase subunit b n=1 Tax=Profundibacterium mesophilum KAUST100406-0324 TaxID=1037889 RepID=A0A921NX22_9RHOB|nr:F0F1 ATP synthase subunit B [Profundibacterium mesophilum]KAF0676931.1 F-type H+-transporting ATPase subunit b [Profundibacterium mesophilum KAUST100406-0324]
MKRLSIVAALAATPAAAASGPFFSLGNTDFVVLIAFVIFIAVLVALKVPSKITEMLDKRAHGIETDLSEARSLREEAQGVLAAYERKHKDVQDQADRIVASAREEAQAAGAKAQADLDESIERRIQGAHDQIASAEAAAVREIRDRAVQIAVAAAGDALARQMDANRNSVLFDEAIQAVETKLH